jgi:pimeloyl-ACP methyl ester carboxylesterase
MDGRIAGVRTVSAVRQSSPQPIVLVHGAWVGEWCWEPVCQLLAGSGRSVHAVSLTGHGRRRAESGPHVTLDDHVADLVAEFTAHDLTEVTLVGHSYGGRVITRAWPLVGSRVARMIYLDAHAPLDGDGADPPVRYPVDDRGMIPISEFVPARAIFRDDAAATAFFARLVPQSPATLSAPFRVELPASLDKTYVFASLEPSPQFRPYAEAAKRDPAWRYIVVPATHWLMYTNPHDVAAIILDPERWAGEHE